MIYSFFLFFKRHFAIFFKKKRNFLFIVLFIFLFLCGTTFIILYYTKRHNLSLKQKHLTSFDLGSDNILFSLSEIFVICVFYYLSTSLPKQILEIIFVDREKKEKDFLVSPVSYGVLMFSYLFFIFTFLSLVFNSYILFLFAVIKYLGLECFSDLNIGWLFLIANVLILASSAFNVFISSVFESKKVFVFLRIYHYIFIIYFFIHVFIFHKIINRTNRAIFTLIMLLPSKIILFLPFFLFFLIQSFPVDSYFRFLLETRLSLKTEYFIFPKKANSWFNVKSIFIINAGFERILIIGLLYSVIFMILIFLVNLPSLKKKIK